MTPHPDLSSFLTELADLSTRSRRAWNPAEYSLATMQSLVDRIHHPERRYPSLHVAGSNGKGSVCALASAALQAQGYRVGLYTSPHLNSPLDGIHLDGRPATAPQLDQAWAALYPHVAGLEGLTLFETVTALAFQVFADQAVDIAVIETGLGGRLDATNVVTPAVAVITPIDLEHMHILGQDLAAIAAEKGGIIKAGVPVVIAPQEAAAAAVLRTMAQEKQAPLIEIGVDFLVERLALDQSGQDIRIRQTAPEDSAHDFRLSLLGAHQALNAATAYAALQLLAERGLPVSDEAVRQGLAALRWPGRLEALGHDPVVLLDGAHTPAAARALARALDDHFPDRAIVAVMGISEDKDPGKLLEPLEGRLEGLYATQSGHARAMPAAQLRRALETHGNLVDGVGQLAEMLGQAAQHAQPRDGLVLVLGSVFLAEQARALLVSR